MNTPEPGKQVFLKIEGKNAASKAWVQSVGQRVCARINELNIPPTDLNKERIHLALIKGLILFVDRRRQPVRVAVFEPEECFETEVSL